MIMEDVAENTVTIGDALEVGQFRIKESAKAFAILSSSLYQNKIRAIIRELSCNARDSRIAAGLSEDFTVHLPTRMEPEFFVKDEGVGLSHEQVMSLYTTYFESTKTTSNLFVGALGLGSKSPFSYTENFTVTAIKDGIRGVYSAFINETGVPSIVCLFTGPTDDANGVEVRIPVALKDHNQFLTEASVVFNWFTIKPECNLTLIHCDTEIKHTYYSENLRNKSVILMGGVAYEFDLVDYIVNAVDVRFVFRMSIGDVDVLPSREGLQNTARTKTAIIGTYNRIVDLVQSKIELELSKIDSVYEKMSYLSHSDDRVEKHLMTNLSKANNPAWQSFEIDKLDLLNLKCSTYSTYSGRKTPRSINKTVISPSPHVKFIYNDTFLSIASIREQYKEISATVFVFTKLVRKDAVDFDAFRKDKLFGANFILASDHFKKVAPPPRVARVANKIGVMYATRKKRYDYCGDSCILKTKDTSIMGGVTYYARLNSENVVKQGNVTISFDSLITLFDSYRIVFLKESSKYDTTGLVDCFDYIDSHKIDKSTFVFENHINSEFRDLFQIIHENNLDVHDAELKDIVNEYISYKKTNSFTKLDKFKEKYPSIYPRHIKKEYDSKTITRITGKYDIIYVSHPYDKPKLVENLINVIHNYK